MKQGLRSHAPSLQVSYDAHTWQISPLLPQALLLPPPRHVVPSQQPGQLWASQTHVSPSQRWPLAHEVQAPPPLPHVPSASPALHVVPSQQPAQLWGWVHSPLALQTSLVQGLPSSGQAVPAALLRMTHLPVLVQTRFLHGALAGGAGH